MCFLLLLLAFSPAFPHDSPGHDHGDDLEHDHASELHHHEHHEHDHGDHDHHHEAGHLKYMEAYNVEKEDEHMHLHHGEHDHHHHHHGHHHHHHHHEDPHLTQREGEEKEHHHHHDSEHHHHDHHEEAPHLKYTEGRNVKHTDNGEHHHHGEHDHHHHDHGHHPHHEHHKHEHIEKDEIPKKSQKEEASSEHSAPSTRSVATTWMQALCSTLLISAAPFLILFAIPLESNNTDQQPLLKILLAFASGGLLGDAFLHLIPHAMSPHSAEGHSHEHSHSHSHSHDSEGGHDHSAEMAVGLWVLAGMVTFLCVEKFVRHVKGGHGHSHGSPKPHTKNGDVASKEDNHDKLSEGEETDEQLRKRKKTDESVPKKLDDQSCGEIYYYYCYFLLHFSLSLRVTLFQFLIPSLHLPEQSLFLLRSSTRLSKAILIKARFVLTR